VNEVRDGSWVTTDEDSGLTLAACVRRRLPGVSWGQARSWVRSGKVTVNGHVELDDAARVASSSTVVLQMSAPRHRPPELQVRLVYRDPEVVVVDKPAGLSSVPFEPDDRDTALDLTRSALRRLETPSGLHVVHRLDRDTSGLLLFARTKGAERALADQLRGHTMGREYLAVAHGYVRAARLETRLVDDRGDGLRGSSRDGAGKRAVTHVRPLVRLDLATVCAVRLETGRTHQIRIHLAECGHPVVGERVYIRDFARGGGRLVESPRLLLHAAILTFVHPTRGLPVRLVSPLPEDFRRALGELGAPAEEADRALADLQASAALPWPRARGGTAPGQEVPDEAKHPNRNDRDRHARRRRRRGGPGNPA